VVGSAAVLASVVLLVAAASSPLVPGDDVPHLRANAADDRAVSFAAPPDRPGIRLVTLEREGSATLGAHLYGPLSDSELADIADGSVADDVLGYPLVFGWPDRPSIAWLIDFAPGRFAWLVTEPEWDAPGGARHRVEASTLFSIPDAAPFLATPRAGGEPVLVIGLAAGLAVVGLAAAGSVLSVATRRGRLDHPVGSAAATGAVAAGIAASLLMGFLALVAESLARSPF
jgi:hypothetical protein